MRPITRTLVFISAAVLIAASFACNRSSSTPDSREANVPPCAQAGPSVALPSEFPANLPLPPGTVITSSQTTAQGGILVGGIIPLPFKESVQFFQAKLPAAGFELGQGDAEMDEAESRFSGHGWRGKWQVNGILNCPAAVKLAVSVSKDR